MISDTYAASGGGCCSWCCLPPTLSCRVFSSVPGVKDGLRPPASPAAIAVISTSSTHRLDTGSRREFWLSTGSPAGFGATSLVEHGLGDDGRWVLPGKVVAGACTRRGHLVNRSQTPRRLSSAAGGRAPPVVGPPVVELVETTFDAGSRNLAGRRSAGRLGGWAAGRLGGGAAGRDALICRDTPLQGRSPTPAGRGETPSGWGDVRSDGEVRDQPLSRHTRGPIVTRVGDRYAPSRGVAAALLKRRALGVSDWTAARTRRHFRLSGEDPDRSGAGPYAATLGPTSGRIRCAVLDGAGLRAAREPDRAVG